MRPFQWLRALPVLLLLALSGSPTAVAGQVCRTGTDRNVAEACLSDRVEALRFEIEESFGQYVELLPSADARDAQRAQDQWERYLEDECQAAGDRYRGGEWILVEILSCQGWGARQRAFQLRLLLAALRGGEFIYDPTCFVPASDRVVLAGWVSERRTEPFSSVVVINLEQPLCTDLGEGPVQVPAVQLVGVSPGLARRAARMHGVPVRVEGRLFLPHLDIHRTPLVMIVHRMDPAGR